MVAIEGSQYCPLHGGNAAVQSKVKESLYNFRVAAYNQRSKQFNEHDDLRSLNNEVGVLRIIIEETLNQCTTPELLIRHGGFLSDTIVKVEKLVTSCHKMERSLGVLLDQNSASQFAQEIVRIYTENQNTMIQKFWLQPKEMQTQEVMQKMFAEELIDIICTEIARVMVRLRPANQEQLESER